MPRLIKNSDFVLYFQGKVARARYYGDPDIWIVDSNAVNAIAIASNLQIAGPDLEVSECPVVWETDADTSSLVSSVSQNN